MWNEIEAIDINPNNWSNVLLDMHRTKKRVLIQALHMIQLISEAEDLELAETYATAAIHLIGSLKDMLEQDLIEVGHYEKWSGSIVQKNMIDDPLLKVLRNIRNYDVHYKTLDYGMQNGMMYYIEGEDIAHTEDNSLFFDEFTWEEYSSWRPKKKDLTPDHIEWFNNQTGSWSVKYICYEAINRYCWYINSFFISISDNSRRG